MITSLLVTPGNLNDGKQYLRLMQKELWQGLPVDTYATDRGYDDGQHHCLLETLAYHSPITSRRIRTMRYAIQAYLTAITLNLKRMVRLLTGTTFKGRARA